MIVLVDVTDEDVADLVVHAHAPDESRTHRSILVLNTQSSGQTLAFRVSVAGRGA